MCTRFSLRRLFVCMFIYAILFAQVAALGLPLSQIVAAIAVITVFVSYDLLSDGLAPPGSPAVSRVMLVVAYYATAFSIATAACVLVFLLPFPPEAAGPHAQGLGEAFDPLVRTFAMLFAYAGGFAAWSAVGSVCCLFALRYSRIAWWLLFLNLPGTVLSSLFIVGWSVQAVS